MKSMLRLIPFAFLLVCIGCAAKPAELEGAINPDKIPVYVPATIDQEQVIGGADLEGDNGSFYSKGL